MMDLLIVTGMSGAGKSQAVVALEDIGYYCVDNVPPSLIGSFSELSSHTDGEVNRMALVVDIRSHGSFDTLLDTVKAVRDNGTNVRILYLDCDNQVIATRYKETRRNHPLMRFGFTMKEAIERERERLALVREQADYLIDTSVISAVKLKDQIRNQFLMNEFSTMTITCTSFGFKHGASKDSDLVFDVRCLSNPFYLPELRPLTGLDAPIIDFVMQTEEAQILYQKLTELLDFLVPLYSKEGKNNLTISFGCTGGNHRSVVFAEKIAEYLSGGNYKVSTLHRDIDRH